MTTNGIDQATLLDEVEQELTKRGHQVHRLLSTPKLFAYHRDARDADSALIAAISERRGRLYLFGDAADPCFMTQEVHLPGTAAQVVDEIERRADAAWAHKKP
jgi:hypothetical protein